MKFIVKLFTSRKINEFVLAFHAKIDDNLNEIHVEHDELTR